MRKRAMIRGILIWWCLVLAPLLTGLPVHAIAASQYFHSTGGFPTEPPISHLGLVRPPLQLAAARQRLQAARSIRRRVTLTGTERRLAVRQGLLGAGRHRHRMWTDQTISCPSPWQCGDMGNPGPAGSRIYSRYVSLLESHYNVNLSPAGGVQPQLSPAGRDVLPVVSIE